MIKLTIDAVPEYFAIRSRNAVDEDNNNMYDLYNVSKQEDYRSISHFIPA